MIMYRIVLLVLFYFLMACQNQEIEISWFQPEDYCDADASDLAATYEISYESMENSMVDTNPKKFSLYRIGSYVLHDYQSMNIAVRWSRTRNGALKQTRYFDEDQRAVEYEATQPYKDIETRWQRKHQIIPDVGRVSMLEVAQLTTDCGSIKVFEKREKNILSRIYWSERLQLPVKLLYRNEEGISRWKLIKLVSKKSQVQKALAHRESYLSTDFADIGDNESDPFFRKMINLGFIEHGASGFYDSDGHDVGVQERH